MTCDAWQASNHNAYLAVTGHWVEEVTPTDWRLRSALLGFTQMNTAHSGARLGRALYDIAKRYQITHKVCREMQTPLILSPAARSAGLPATTRATTRRC